MIPAEKRLIKAAKERAFASVVYARAAAINRTAHDGQEAVYQRAGDAADKAYQAVIKAELGPRVKATEEALRWANDDWQVWNKEYTAALKAMTTGEEALQWDDEDWRIWDEEYTAAVKTLMGKSDD